MLLQAHPEAAREKNRFQELPLHFACRGKKAPLGVVQRLIEAYPAAAADQDGQGCLTLHIAVEIDASVEVVDMLLQAHPEAAREKGRDQQLPLHVACRGKAPPGVVQRLFETYPAAV
jgi:hypothetical protein